MEILKIPRRPARVASAAGALALLLCSAGAHAQAGAACDPKGTLAETNACAVQAWQQADAAIAILYGDVMRALSANERPQLRQEQAAWQRERITRCKQATRATEALPEGPRLYHECLAAETEARRRGLMRWLTLEHPSAKP
ncbi:lysozyme inhibitor LprI family protein [Paracidovorax oryzae]|uniref:lysozyme inhibitor LprI family protein n=1 Tax=Paracidovorax oryzae TaxID=862720 RepID=UPI0003612279|nr:lysozyme inhibitor LprI family protein [Paracidovorax oryzae]